MSRWSLLDPIRTRIADEQGTLVKQARARIALCYPSPYHVGMSSLGFQTIYREINQHPRACAERAFLPDEAGAPVVSYEQQRPLGQFDALAFSVSYELELPGVFSLLEAAGLRLHAGQR